VSSTTQDDKEEEQDELFEPPTSGDSGRPVASSTVTSGNSTELKQKADSSSTVTITSPKGDPERLLKREESTPKFNLLDLLTSEPLEANSGKKSRKRMYPDRDNRDIEEESPKKSMPSRAKEGYYSGTTAVVGILREKEFIVANAGDSKCVLSSKGEKKNGISTKFINLFFLLIVLYPS